MKSLLTFFTLTFALTMSIQAQFSENFENGFSNWTITSAAAVSWEYGTNTTLGSQYFNPPAHTQFMGVNDDVVGAGNNTSGTLASGNIDLSALTNPILSFAAFFINGDYGGNEVASVLVSENGGASWVTVYDVPGDGEWQDLSVPLFDYAGQNIRIAFGYNDGSSWNYGFCVDDISIADGLGLDAELLSVTSRTFGLTDQPYKIIGKIYNNGTTNITSVDVTYTVSGSNPVSATIDNINIPSFSEYKFEHPTPWIPQNVGEFVITVRIDEVNGSIDQVATNNELDHDVIVYENVVIPNIIDSYPLSIPEYTEIGNSSNQLDAPTDLDFHPVLALNELWVINERIESTGGSTVTYYNAGQFNQTFDQRVDGNAWHFMSLPTALAFGDAGDWASSTGVLDANHAGGTFTGPTLWSSDPDIYAQPSGGNGSHLDMLHGSPYSMGICHEEGNAYWVFDGYNEHIVRYDFKEDHGPGNDDHADGEVRRFTNIEVKKDGNIPSHLILDKSTGWLYVVDNGNDRVLRLDINSTSVINSNLPLINEPLAVHASMDADWEVIITEGLGRPCGIDLIENRLLVSDYASGDIIVYDMDNNFAEMYRIETGAPGITGIKIGPDGNIWYTNRITNKVMMVAPGEPVSVNNLRTGFPVSIEPNPTSGKVNISLPGNTEGNLFYKIFNATGQQILEGNFSSNFERLDLSAFQDGIYFIQIYNETQAVTKKIVLNK